MYGGRPFFDGITTATVVRHGGSFPLNWGGLENRVGIIHREMILQIATDYPGLPDVRTLTLSQIRFFYEGVRARLEEATKDG